MCRVVRDGMRSRLGGQKEPQNGRVTCWAAFREGGGASAVVMRTAPQGEAGHAMMNICGIS